MTQGNPFIPLSEPHLGGSEWAYVKECLDTNWVSSVGSYVDRFEKLLAGYVSARHAVATVNGTAALHLALLVAGVQPEDEVLVSDLTFIAPANAVRYVGAWPVFVDAEPDHWQMDPRKVLEFLSKDCEWRQEALYNRVTGRRVKAIIPVHILGHPVDMDPILEAARTYGLTVIEDATESLGAQYKGRPVGSLGDIGCFSFNGNKIITTGGGGMLVTDSSEYVERARSLSTQAKDDPIEYIHAQVGYNYRLTNLQAAMGCAQMEQLDAFVLKKRRIADLYTKALGELPGLTLPREAPWASSTFWLYTITVDEARYGRNSRQLLRDLDRAGIQTRPLWQPMHLSRVFTGMQHTDCGVAEQLNLSALSLPSSVHLSPEEQQRVCEVITRQQVASLSDRRREPV